MSAQGFKSVYMAGSVAVAALGCYMVSLNVASERASLENVERKILLAQRDIRVLQTEIGTRGRLEQLERWNAGFIQLSAPSAEQILGDSFQLATLNAPEKRQAIDAPVVYAAAEAPPPRVASDIDDSGQPLPRPTTSAPAPSEIMHVASYSRPEPVRVAPSATNVAKAAPAKSSSDVAKKSPKTVTETAKAKPVLALKPATKAVKSAAADPLAPLPKSSGSVKASAKPKSRTP